MAFPPDLYEDLKKIASREERDATSQIIKVLKDFVSEYKQKHGEDLGPLVPALLQAA